MPLFSWHTNSSPKPHEGNQIGRAKIDTERVEVVSAHLKEGKTGYYNSDLNKRTIEALLTMVILSCLLLSEILVLVELLFVAIIITVNRLSSC
jgi:hypothetical protein